MGDASIIHYIFCFFSAHLLMEIKTSLVDNILLQNLQDSLIKNKTTKENIRLYINLINASFDLLLIIIVIFLILTRKRYIKKKRLKRAELEVLAIKNERIKRKKKTNIK